MPAKHFNALHPAEQERLVLLMEECGEVIQAAAKALRHGYDSSHPAGGYTNRENIEMECGHVKYAMLLLTEKLDLSGVEIQHSCTAKASSVKQYLHHQDNVKR